MEQDDLIRRLKVLSKSQSAFLKAYCHSKLNGGVELVKEALKLLKASGFRDKDKKINDIYEKIEQLKLEEIEVNLDSAELLMKSEIALLRASVENNQEPTSSTNLTNDAQQVTSLNSKIQSLETDNKKLRDLLEKAKSELVAYSKASSAVPPPPSPVAMTTNQQSYSNEEDILKIASLETALQDIQTKAAEKDAQFKRLELICLGYEEEIENHKSLKQSTISAEAGRFKAELDSLQTKFENTVKEYENKLNEEKGKSEKSLSTLEARLETEKEEMMEAMAQEIEEIEKTNHDKITSLEQKINELSGQLSKSQSNRSNIINGLAQIKSKFATIKQTRKSVSEESKKLLQSFGNSFTTELGDKLKYKLKSLGDALAESFTRYKREMAERKRLHNLVQELKGNIRVFMRCRPPTSKEIDQFGNDALCVSFPPGDNEVKLLNEKGREKVWEFDALFGLNSTQEQVYSEVSSLVVSVLDGYNVCIFAYGQTGSGKTYTMAGIPSDRGVNTRALDELFEKCSERKGEWLDTISISVLEVYNEEIRDLLTDNPNTEKLEVRQGESGNYIPGLISLEVYGMEDIEAHLSRADRNRSQSSTNMNEHSSRSHMILTVYVSSQNLLTGLCLKAKLNLVDLAGSERVNKSGAQGQAMKEAQNINKSLSALGDVIQARGAKQSHVPFRNSTLTYLLQDSLSQDSKTLMFVCISPVLYNSEESFCSLNFASRVRAVELGKATKNIVASTSAQSEKSNLTSAASALLAANRMASGGTKSSLSKKRDSVR